MNARSPALSIVVPAFNEAKRIRETVASIQNYLASTKTTYEIVVVADGTDATREIVSEMARSDSRLTVLGTSVRRGKGCGVREGMLQARGQLVGFVDADNKTPIEELTRLMPWFEKGYDVVIGSRGLAETRIENPQPLYRQIGSRVFGICMRTLTGLHGIRDTQCGFKFFRAEVARDLFQRQWIDGYMFDVEILCLAQKAGYSIKEVGVRWRDDGDSRLDLVAGNWRNFVDLMRIRFWPAPVARAQRLIPPATRERAA